jgi:glc operon protein GlcG
MFRIKSMITTLALMFCISVASNAQQLKLATKSALTLDVAKELAKTAAGFANKNNWNVVIAIVDDGGHIIYLERMDGVQTGSIEVAIQKAKTATAYKRSSKVFADGVKGGRTELMALPGAMPLEGGLPITWNNQIIGAIGISGVTPEQDGMIAESATNSLAKILK